MTSWPTDPGSAGDQGQQPGQQPGEWSSGGGAQDQVRYQQQPTQAAWDQTPPPPSGYAPPPPGYVPPPYAPQAYQQPGYPQFGYPQAGYSYAPGFGQPASSGTNAVGQWLAIGSLIAGLLSIFFCWLGLISVFEVLLGVVLGGVALGTGTRLKGPAIAGMVCAVFGFVLYFFVGLFSFGIGWLI